MAAGTRLKRALITLIAAFGALLWLAALLLFSRIAENSDDFSRLQQWILLINITGIALLVALIAGNLVRLIRDYRRHVPGSRLKVRMVTLLVVLAVAPLAAVYLFSVQFINRGIDSWFSVDVEQGLANALDLSQTALDLQRRENLEQLQRAAQGLLAGDYSDLVSQLSALRRDSRAIELTLYGPNYTILGSSSEDPRLAVPGYPSEEVMFQVTQGPHVSLEPRADGQYQILAALSLQGMTPAGEARLLQGRFPVEQRLSVLADAVAESYNQYEQLSYLRTALKYSFTLTLSLVVLITLLASVYGAFFSARRLVVPIQQLMHGTRAVARGDFRTRVTPPAAGRDEIGFLINSFNDMTQRLATAHEQAHASQLMVESERRKLEVILARLTTGVLSLEPDLRIRTVNESAAGILGIDLGAHVGESLIDLAPTRPLLSQFLEVCLAHLKQGNSEWREQIVLRGDEGRRVLMCACTELPSEGESAGGYVLVFDDITALLQAQKDAAWGEVARRLAHEIKNPLTPIQLSAERLRRRYMRAGSPDQELLERATHTIIEQVEAMKSMVNAFSEYARTPGMEWTRFDLNGLVREVTELYRHHDQPVSIELELDESLPRVEADRGRMRQVLHNLLRNALEATEQQEDARITVGTRQVAQRDFDMVEIRVADNGPGFVPEIIDQAFDPYVTSKPRGTGLGLAIVKKLIEEHGGQIAARNLKNGGAELSVLLPLADERNNETKEQRRVENWRERA
jgi:nitrogen fixation/metabolism regulation signal transduction histidine kinase